MRGRCFDVVGFVVLRQEHRARGERDELGVGACLVGSAGAGRQLVLWTGLAHKIE